MYMEMSDMGDALDFVRETLATFRCFLQWHVYLALSPVWQHASEGRKASSIGCINSEFHKVQWRYFSCVVNKCKNNYVEFLHHFLFNKIITQSGLFLTKLLKKSKCDHFLGHCI